MGYVLGIIPARGGSKGIPGKNIIDIKGKPLIAYSIETGLCAVSDGFIDKLIVSTDDEEIAEVSKKYGAEIPFMRPKALSGDKAMSVDVMIHAYEFFKSKGTQYDTLVLLQPTAPLRVTEDIKESLRIYKQENSMSLISCYLEEYICDNVTYKKNGNHAIAMSQNHNKGVRRQEEEKLYVRNGAIYITDSERMVKEHTVFGNEPCMYVMPKERSVNIDTMDDVEMLRWLVSR